MEELTDKIKNSFPGIRLPLLLLALGMLMMLLPVANKEGDSALGEEELLAHLLSCAEGLGDTKLILSENGVIVVCEGADNAKIRLDIIRAIDSYTGYSSDKITILKMAD